MATTAAEAATVDATPPACRTTAAPTATSEPGERSRTTVSDTAVGTSAAIRTSNQLSHNPMVPTVRTGELAAVKIADSAGPAVSGSVAHTARNAHATVLGVIHRRGDERGAGDTALGLPAARHRHQTADSTLRGIGHIPGHQGKVTTELDRGRE